MRRRQANQRWTREKEAAIHLQVRSLRSSDGQKCSWEIFPRTYIASHSKKAGAANPRMHQKAFSRKDWKLVPRQAGEKRVALVLVVSDYRQSRASSLPGAAHDAHRIADALTKAGFVTETALNLDLSNMRRKLAEFAAASTDFDAAAIYTTGHGLETNGEVYLIPGDYPRNEGNAALRAKALPLAVIANAARAKHVNLVLYGGCRDDPFSN